jgi:Cu(I)/Ag(I) efflux system membrane protein CusA/SilA
MKRIAAPMVGGMLSSTILTLLVIPAIYSLWRQRETAPEYEPVSMSEPAGFVGPGEAAVAGTLP